MTRYQKFLLIVLIAGLLLSIYPADQTDWLLELLPLFVAVPALFIAGHYLKASNTAYTLIALYLLLPMVAAHYGVAGVPLGFTLGKWLHTTRNMFDRLEHFAFGFLCTYFVREMFVRVTTVKGFWSYVFPINITLAFSAVYEIFEWLCAVTVNPASATRFIGAGGDFYDTPKDMGMALVGVLLTMLILFIVNHRRRRTGSGDLHEKVPARLNGGQRT